MFPRPSLPYRLPSFAEVRAVLYYRGFKNIYTKFFSSDNLLLLLLLTKREFIRLFVVSLVLDSRMSDSETLLQTQTRPHVSGDLFI